MELERVQYEELMLELSLTKRHDKVRDLRLMFAEGRLLHRLVNI